MRVVPPSPLSTAETVSATVSLYTATERPTALAVLSHQPLSALLQRQGRGDSDPVRLQLIGSAVAAAALFRCAFEAATVVVLLAWVQRLFFRLPLSLYLSLPPSRSASLPSLD